MNKPVGYRLSSYGDMVVAGPRIQSYRDALAAAVQPGCTVLDIGAGPGVLSMLALDLGAAHVIAVDPDPSVITALDIAKANGVADRLTVHQDVSTAVSLDRPADIIVSDLRGVLPLLQHHVASIVDARSRLLAQNGRLIPRADTLWAALVDAPETYRSYDVPWRQNDLGLDLTPARPFVVNSWRKVDLDAEELLVAPQAWAVLDYEEIIEPDVAGELVWEIEEPATSHGVAVWFDADLHEGIGFSNAPGETALIYGQAFFPWEDVLELLPGDSVTVNLRADLVADDYIWTWGVRVSRDGGRHSTSQRLTTFNSGVFSQDDIRRQEARHVPTLDEDGRLTALVLSLMDGEASLKEIADRTFEAFPHRFSSWEGALTEAGRLSVKYGRR